MYACLSTYECISINVSIAVSETGCADRSTRGSPIIYRIFPSFSRDGASGFRPNGRPGWLCAVINTCDSHLAIEISIPLQDSILRESQSLRDSVLRDANIPKAWGLCVNSDGFVLRGSKVVISDSPDVKRLQIAEFHDTPYAGHFGQNKTYEAVSKFFWWPSLKADVQHHTSGCDPCQRHKARLSW
jgi:hypothetical protein